jgi:hypothetical protein
MGAGARDRREVAAGAVEAFLGEKPPHNDVVKGIGDQRCGAELV